MIKKLIISIFGVLFVLAGLPCFLLAKGNEYYIKPAPEWVTIIPAEEKCSVPEKQFFGGICYLLVDEQVYVNGVNTEIFTRRVEKILNNEGIQSFSELYFNFDPSYQAVTLHSIRIIRNQISINQLQAKNISVMQREEDLEYRIYNGEKTISIILEDVRVNDSIEYAYTIKGINPVFKGYYFDYWKTGWKHPVQHLYWSLLIPQNLPLYIKNHQLLANPTITNMGQYKKYIFDRNHIPAIVTDSDVPSWYDSYPWFQVGQFDKWSEVAQWGTQLYAIPATMSYPLQQIIDSIKKSSKDPVQRLAAAMEIVQRDIRYLGIEIGSNSYAPTDPSVVFQRRFGDCKDKSFLLATVLNKIGITAYPALVNTYYRDTIAKFLPSPIEFNHVVVYAKSDGKDYWLDPTITYQGVPFEQIEQPDYGVALLLNASTKTLTPMKPVILTEPEAIIIEKFALKKDKQQPVTLFVETLYRGREADTIRTQIKSLSHNKLEKSFLNFYAEDYPSIKTAKPLTINDNKKLNQVRTTEQYSITTFWTLSDNNIEQEGTFRAGIIKSRINFPETRIRTAPLAVEHPVFIQQKIIAALPGGWDVENSDVHIEDEAISFDVHISTHGQELIILYEYKTKAKYVSLENVKKHIDNLEEIRNVISYSFTAVNELTWKEEINWLISAIAVAILILSTIGAALVYRLHDPEPAVLSQNISDKKDLEGIGGWLIVVAIGLFLSPLYSIYSLILGIPAYINSKWQALTTPGSFHYHPSWAPLLLGELTVNICLLAFYILLLILFFKKRQIFPAMFIIIRIAAVIFIAFDYFASLMLNTTTAVQSGHSFKEVTQQGIYTLIWSLYMVNSIRVKLTFRAVRSKLKN